MVRSFEGHTDTIRMVAWSPDWRRIASAAHDRTVRIWDAGTGGCLRVLEGHPTPVVGAAWRGEREVLSCDQDAQVRAWDVLQ